MRVDPWNRSLLLPPFPKGVGGVNSPPRDHRPGIHPPVPPSEGGEIGCTKIPGHDPAFLGLAGKAWGSPQIGEKPHPPDSIPSTETASLTSAFLPKNNGCVTEASSY